MAKAILFSPKTLKPTMYLLLLAIVLGCADSARMLDEVEPQPRVIADAPEAFNPLPTPVLDMAPDAGPTINTLPSGQIPATDPTDTVTDNDADPPLPETEAPDTAPTPVADVESPVVDVAPIPAPVTTSPGGSGSAPIAATSATVTKPNTQHPALSFFMHDILGGSHPSVRLVTGIIANSEINGLPFSKPSNNIFPLNNGVPLQNSNNGILNNNNLPFLTGLNGAQTSTVFQNSANNNPVNGGNNQPFVTAGQLPAGATIQKLVFGTVTVIDDELTEGHELGSAVIGKAQGFYLASSLDGTSQTIAVTALLHGGEHEEMDAISFFGVHRTASVESQIAVVGGTGKYENAKGYAVIETLHQEDQHTTDGVDTLLQFSVYLSE